MFLLHHFQVSCRDPRASREDDQRIVEANAEEGILGEGAPDSVACRAGRMENMEDRWDLRRRCLDLQVPRC